VTVSLASSFFIIISPLKVVLLKKAL